MPTQEKARTIDQAKEWYSGSAGVLFTDYRGLKVKELQQLRRALKEKDAEIHIIKNTLFRLAAGDDVQKLPDELHNGPTAVTFVHGSESDAAKALVDFAHTHQNFKVKGGLFGGKALSPADVVSLSKLPPRDVLIAQVIGAIAAPLTSLIGVIEALYADPIRTIGAVADKVAEGSPIPEAQAAPAEDVPAEAPAASTAEAPAKEAEAPTADTPAAEAATTEAPAAETPAAE
jgi:large subunit ribosomal protein L10